jgi:ferrous iron transport protein A
MKINQKGKIVAIEAGRTLTNRFMSMGIYPGSEVTKLSHFIMRGPIAIRVGRTVLALGYGMAHKILIEIND